MKNRLYKIASSILKVPAAAYCMSRSDLRQGVVKRFWPKPIDLELYLTSGKNIWIHAASVGEVKLANHFAAEYLREQKDDRLMLTCNTTSGMELSSAGVYHFVRQYPFDTEPGLTKLFDSFRPDLIVLVEMELWPGLLIKARERGIKVVVINARMSDNSASKYKNIFSKFEGLIDYPNYLTRNDIDFQNLLQAGVPLEKLTISGEMKIDIIASAIKVGAKPESQKAEGKKLFLAVSTHSGEEEIILEAYRGLQDYYPDLQLVLAPRHLNRVPHVLRLAASKGFATAKAEDYSDLELSWADIIVEDQFGRLDRWYRQADIAFVGGSLVDAGCHNVLEPILYNVPVLVGSHQGNWKNWIDLLDEANAASVIDEAHEIVRITGIVFEETEDVLSAVMQAKARILQQFGTTKRNIKLIGNIINGE